MSSVCVSYLEENKSRSWPANFDKRVVSELKTQQGIAVPLVAMNLSWFIKIAITTAFLGRLGELQLAGGALGLTFANVTGFSVLTGLSGAMEPICGQAYGAKNSKLLHKTLLMTIFLLLLVTVPISFLWLHVDKIFIHFGQQEDLSVVARSYLFYLLPDLVITAIVCPLKAYLSSQGITIPIMFSYGLALALHVPINIFLAKAKGLEGVAMAAWISDLIVLTLLAIYVIMMESTKEGRWKEGGWLDQSYGDWIRLLKLSGTCCLTTCLEWWGYEILVLMTGHLNNAKEAVGILTIVLNFDYLLFAVMLSLATCASIRASNELGANRPGAARYSAYVSLTVSVITGCICSLVMVAGRGTWGALFSHNKRIVRGVKKMLLLMSLLEIVNFPLAVCGGIVRGTARPWLAMYANIVGFYLIALPLAAVLAFKVELSLGGMLMGFLVGIISCLVLLLVFIFRINWDEEANKAQFLADSSENENIKTAEAVNNGQVRAPSFDDAAADQRNNSRVAIGM
ncbi:protein DETOXIFICATION 56 [Cannabis sativa]|uniref:protein DETOXIFICATION 56 n=1 Tax=Cannabis sativa TaxID=3483 RepID=UPI0029CA237B|nr:protein DETOXIFICATION 56 [Cannabis sativa]